MSQKNIDINELNNFNFQLGPSVSNQPEQELPELYFTATAPVMFGRSFFNNWQTITAPFTPNTLAGAEQERYGIMPDTTLASIANLENWTGKKPNVDDFWEYRKANYLLTGGSGSGFLGRDVDLYALERAKHGYWSGPYFKMQNPLLENMDQMELAYNDYLQNLKTAKQEVKNNLGIDGEPIAYYDDAGIPRTKDGKLAFSSKGDIKIKYDGKEIPSHEVPEPMSLEQFKARTKAFNDAGAISRWMLSTQAEGGYLSGNALVGALVDTAFDNPLYSNNLDDEYAKESAIKLSLAKYNSGLDVFEQGVGTIASDIKELIDKKEPNFDGSTWFDNLSLPKEVRESLASKGISSIDFIGTNNKNHALFILQDKLFKRTLQEKIESYENNSSIFDNTVIGFIADLPTIAVNDPDLAIGIAATAATAGIGGLAKAGQAALSATKYANKARVLQRTLQLAQTGVKAAAALSTGELPSFMHKLSHLKRIGYIGSVGAGLNMVANAKDQSTRIAMSMTGLQTDHQFEYSKKELIIAGAVGFGFGTTVYGATYGLGKLKTKLFKKDTTTGSVRLETPEGTDATVITPTPITKDAIDETIATAVASNETTTPSTTSVIKEIEEPKKQRQEMAALVTNLESGVKNGEISELEAKIIILRISKLKTEEDGKNFVQSILAHKNNAVRRAVTGELSINQQIVSNTEYSAKDVIRVAKKVFPTLFADVIIESPIETPTVTTTTPVIETIKTVDLELEGVKYKFREDDLRKIEPTAERNTVENIYIQREDGIYEIPKLSLDEAKLRAIEVKDLPPITGESKTRLERIASDAEKASDSATIKEDGRTGTLGIAPESPIFSRVVGESTLDYGQRSIDSNQVADEKDWTRLVATKEEIQAIQAEPKAYNKIRKLRDISTRAIDVLKQLRESGRTSKDSTWFTDQEINLNRHIADLQKLEYDLIGREHKGFTTLTPQNKTKFLELAEKYKALPKEEFDAKINEEKNLNRKFRKALKDYIYGKEPKAETLKIKPTDSPLVKKLKETTNSVLAKRKTKPRSLNASQTKKAQKAFIDLDYGKSISEEHNRLITYFENELNRVNLPSQVIKDATKLLSASLVNLKLNPAKLIKYLDMSTRKGIFGQTEPTRVGENFIFGLKLDELNLTDLTPAEVSQAATRIALHELGHIYSFVLDVNQQIDLYKAYSDNVDLDLLRHLTSVDERFQKSGVESESAYYLSNAAEFFANMFDSLVFTRTVEAISKLENQSLFTKLMLPFFKYIKDVASKLIKNFSKSAFRDLDDTISEMIEVADLVSERSSTDSASLGVISFEAQKLLPKDTIAFDGLLSYRNYLDTVSETLFTKASKTNNQAGLKLGDIVADLVISDKSIIKVQSELLNKLNKFTDAELEEVTKLIPNYDQFKELFVDFTDDNRTQNLLTVVAYLMPNRIEEVMAAIHTTVGSTISSKLQGFISEEISSAFEDIAETADTYKAKSLAYTIPTLFEDYTSIEDMYKNNQSIVSLLRDIKDNPKLEQNIPFIKLKMPNVADTIGGGYLNQFVFLDDILQNISDTTGLSLDNILTSNQIYGELDRVTMSLILGNPQILKKALMDGTQPHNITNFETLITSLMDVSTESSVIKYLLETYLKDTEVSKVFSLQPVLQRLETDRTFEAQLLKAAEENQTIDGFAKAISSILVEEKKKKIKKERKLVEKVDTTGSISTTPKFKKWFENSKVVDSDNKPLVMYHGTPVGGFDVFKLSKSPNFGLFGSGFYFTADPKIASSYALKIKGNVESSSVYPVYLQIKNPMDMDKAVDINLWEKALKEYDISTSKNKRINQLLNSIDVLSSDINYVIKDALEYIIKEQENITNEQAFRKLQDNVSEYVDDGEEFLPYLFIELFERGGIDGLTHIGGGRIKPDSPRHRVYIAFKAEQIKSIFDNADLPKLKEQPKQEEVKVPDTYITEDIAQVKDADSLVTMIGEVITETIAKKKEKEIGRSRIRVTPKTKLGASIRKYLINSWSGIKTESVEDLVQKVIEKILMNRDKVNADLSKMTTEREKFNYVFKFANNVAREAATKQKRKAQKVSYGLVTKEGEDINVADARIAIESEKPVSQEKVKALQDLIPKTNLSGKVKDIASNYATVKRNNPEMSDKAIATLMGITDKQLQNAKAALKKQVIQIDGEFKLVNDEARPTTKKEVIVETSRSQAAKQTDKILTGKEKPKVVSLEEARAKLEQARNIRTNVQAATSPVVKELPAAMPEVQTKTGDEVMFVSGETKDESVKAGSILVPENKAMLIEQQTELPAVSSVIVTREIRSLNLPVVKNNIIDSITSAPEELFSDLGIEKELLLEVLRESKTPEVDLINILKESNIQLIKLTKEDTTVAAIPTTDETVKKVVTMDTGSRLPTIRKPIDPPVVDDPKIVVDKPVADPEKLPVEMDPRTGRAPATEPKIKKGIAETVVLSDVDKFDAQMMAGESLLRNSGTDPKFIKVLLLNFHRVTAGLRENLGKKVETLPDQFLHFLDKVYNIYATISNINQEKFGTRFEAINNIFWEYYDIELAKELDARSTPAEQISVKTLDQILEFAKAKTDQAIDSYNKRYGTNLPEFTRPPSPHDFIFSSKDITLRYPDKMGMRKGSYAAVTYAGAKTPVDAATVTRDLGLGVVVDLTPEKLPPTQGILLNFLNNLATEHTEVFRSTNFIARWFRGSEKENRNAFRKALNFITGLTSLATGESKTLYSMNNLLRWLSSMAESGKVMTHQLVKSGTHAFKTWEGAAHQVQRSKTALIKLNRELAIQTGDLRVMQKVELEIVKSLVATKRQLQRTDIEAAVLAINPAAQPAYIDAIFNAAKNLRDETIRRNKFILDLENSTEWISIKDDAGNPIPAENYFALTFDRNKVTKNDRSQIVDEMVRVRKETIKNDETLDRSIMLSMGWLWDSDGNPLTTRGKEGRDQLHVGETGFDADTLSRLEAKAGNRRYAPGTDLKRIPEIRKEADTKFFSYVDPATAQVVICAIPEKVSDLSPRDLARYMETVDGSTAHIAEQWKDNYGNTKPVLQVMMEELLAFKLREGNYHRYIQKPEMGDNAFLQLFGKGGDNQGFAVKNLNWKETFNSPLILDIIRTNPLEAYDNLINHRGFELLVQAELDRMLGHKGIRIYEVFDAASKLLMRMAGSNEKLQKDLQGGMQRLAEDYAEYAGRNPRIQSAYGEAGEQLSRAAGGIIRANSGQRWGLRTTAESFINIIAALPEVGTKETINNLFYAFKLLIDRKPSSALKQELFLTVHGIRSYLTDIEDRYLPTGAVSGVPSLNDSWWKRATKSREDSWKAVAAIEKLGSLGVEIGSVKYITAASKHFAMVRFVHRNAKYIMSGAALRLTALMENPVNKAELERLQALSVTSEKADKQLAALQKKLAREAGFGGNWDHALTFMRFRLLDSDKLKALKYILDQTGTNKNGVVNLGALQAKVDAYMTGPIGPISKEVLDEAFNDFMYAIETQITTNGMISESRGLNRDISFSSRTPLGKLFNSLLQWSQSFHSNVLRNLQLKKPTVIMAELVIAYSAFTYLSELILDWLNGRDVSDIKEELKDPSTSVYRMASTIPVFGSLSGPFSASLAMMSQLYGGTFKGFNNPITPPSFGVLTAYGIKALGSTKDLLSRSGEMSPEEIVAKFGDIIPFNITMNNSPIAMPARLLEQMGVISEQDAFGRYLDLIQKGKNKYIEDRKVANYNRVAPMGSKEIEKQLRASRDSLLEQTNQMIESRKKMGKNPIIFRNKGVSTDLTNLLEDMSNNQ